MEEFCENPSLKLYNKLKEREKKILVEYSQKVVDNKIQGNKRFANRILKYHHKIPVNVTLEQLKINHDRWRTSIKEGKYHYDILQPNTLVFRGSGKHLELVKDKPTYFALEFYDSTTYVTFGTRIKKTQKPKDNFLVGILIKPIQLFKVDSLDNINLLLRESFNKEKDLYEAVVQMFMSQSDLLKYRMHPTLPTPFFLEQIESATKPFQFRKLYRFSAASHDFMFVNWLCKHGFQGYSAGNFETYSRFVDRDKTGLFHAEIVICDPLSYVHVLGTVHIEKPKTMQALQNILINLQKNTKIKSYYRSK